MEISFVDIGNNRELLQIDNARIIYRNFAGRGGKYNREGDRNFSVVIPDAYMDYHGEERAISDVLLDHGYRVRIKPARAEDEGPFMHLPVKIRFNARGPKAYLEVGKKRVTLDEDSFENLDDVDILRCDLDIVPYDSEVNGKMWRTAYLRSIRVVQNVDRFERRYAEEEAPEEEPLDF